MGNSSKSLYSKQDWLYYHIERRDIPNIRKLLESNPQLINTPLTKDTQQTALMRTAYNGNLEITTLLLSFHADPNYVTPKGQTALSTAVKRCHESVAEQLMKAGADVGHISPLGFRIIDYAILGGFYPLAQSIFKKMSPKEKEAIEDPLYYEAQAKKYSYRYVNYEQFLQGLVFGTDPNEMPNFLRKEKKKLVDPVVDPRQTWKQWFKRQMQWQDAPLVERTDLPENMQPQNRVLGKAHHYTNNLMSTHLSQKTKLYPENKEYLSQMADINNEKEGETMQKFNEARSEV